MNLNSNKASWILLVQFLIINLLIIGWMKTEGERFQLAKTLKAERIEAYEALNTALSRNKEYLSLWTNCVQEKMYLDSTRSTLSSEIESLESSRPHNLSAEVTTSSVGIVVEKVKTKPTIEESVKQIEEVHVPSRMSVDISSLEPQPIIDSISHILPDVKIDSSVIFSLADGDIIECDKYYKSFSINGMTIPLNAQGFDSLYDSGKLKRVKNRKWKYIPK